MITQTQTPFEKLRDYAFRDPVGHSLALCADFQEAEKNYDEQLSAIRSALATLSQPAVFQDDIEEAKRVLAEAIERSEVIS